ncbi:XRE family transcriptional regulator [Campylobacter sp. MOP7]|uniref:XRE family transcriptional regulator n=1 Tax=Campylobacter canis TaxID=3378588 RepID=UPI00387E7A4B
MELSEVIKKARLKKGLTQKELADRMGLTQGTIGQYETKKGEIGKDGKEKKTASPSLDKIPEMAEILEIDVTDFFPSHPSIKKQIVKKELKNNFEKYAEYIPDGKNIKEIAFLSKSEMRIDAGAEGVFDLTLFESEERRVAVDRAVLKGLNPANLKLFEVVGDSMQPEYHEGDLAIVDMANGRDNFTKIAGIYIVRVVDVVYVKRVEFLPENKIKLISLNPIYGEIYPHQHGYDCEILGKVCGKIHYEIQKGLTFDDNGIS